MSEVKHPFGAADHQQPVFAATITPTIKNGVTLLEPAILTGNLLIDVTPDAELEVGAVLVVKIKTTVTETVTYGASIIGPVVTGVAAKTFLQSFIWDGSNFVASGVKQQID